MLNKNNFQKKILNANLNTNSFKFNPIFINSLAIVNGLIGAIINDSLRFAKTYQWQVAQLLIKDRYRIVYYHAMINRSNVVMIYFTKTAKKMREISKY